MSRYWPGDRGRRYAYATEITYECPVGKMAHQAQTDGPGPSGDFITAAGRLGIEPRVLGRLLSRASCGARERVNDKPTDRCVAHGCKMDKRGWRAYIDEPVPEKDWTEAERTTTAFNRRINDPHYTPRRVIEQRWCDTKKEAREWAYRKLQEAERAAGQVSP